ncbi:hypothetical protein Tco_0871305 [Tanacetum coccineum]
MIRGNQAPGMVKPEIGANVNFKIKSQFMRELREDTFSENKNDDAHEHVERVLYIVSLFNIPGVTHDAFMLRVFPITLTGAAKRYCPPSKTAKQLEDIRNFKRDIDSSSNSEGIAAIVNKLDSLGPLSGSGFFASFLSSWSTGKKVQERKRDSDILCAEVTFGSNSKGIATIVNKLDSLGRDMKKLKENMHAIQVGCQTCEGAHLDKECPLNEDVKSIKEVKYREFGRPFLNNIRNDGRFNRGASGYDQPSLGERRPSLTKIINKYMEKEAKRHAKQDKWFSDNEKQEIDKSKMEEALAALEAKLEIKKVPQEDKKCVSYYVEPYEPPILFPRRLEHHAKEALIHETMESLKKIKINRPLLKEIRQTDAYTNHMKNWWPINLGPKKRKLG